jgi:RNA polymerase sigma factor (sigma-70 family)
MHRDRGHGINGRSTFPFGGAGTLHGICRRALRTAPAALRDDCESEAWLVLWQVQDRLERLPEGERTAYAAVCVRHRIGQICRKERQRWARLVPLESVGSVLDGTRHVMAESPDGDWPHGGRLDDQISRMDLAEAVSALSDRDRHLLDLYYARQLTDSEIARQWHVTAGAVKMQRHRAIVKIRRAIGHAPSG